MGMRNQHGFTIIELLLFISITGLLAITLLGGWTTMINTQHYRDSVKTTQAFIQQQYNLVYNVQNGRSADLGCTAGAGPNDLPTIDVEGRVSPGQSENCIIMGRYIHITNGSDIKVYVILGRDGESDEIMSDDEAILERNPVRIQDEVSLSQNELAIPWEAAVVTAGNPPVNMDMAIVIIRSPESGAVHTYASPSAGTLPLVKDIIDTWQAAGDTDINLCLDSGVPLSGGRMGVVIKAGASSQSSVQTIVDGEGTCE